MAKVALSVRVEDDDRAIVSIGGDLDLAAAPGLRDALAEVIDADHREVVLDAIDVTFCDSTGLGVLLSAARVAGTRGQRIVVWRPRRALEDVLRLAGAEQILPIRAA
jgi:anti-sigma B factor antagonist